MRTAGIIVLVVLIGALTGWCLWLTRDLTRTVERLERVQWQLWDMRHDIGQLGEGHLEVQERVAQIDDLLTLPGWRKPK